MAWVTCVGEVIARLRMRWRSEVVEVADWHRRPCRLVVIGERLRCGATDVCKSESLSVINEIEMPFMSWPEFDS